MQELIRKGQGSRRVPGPGPCCLATAQAVLLLGSSPGRLHHLAWHGGPGISLSSCSRDSTVLPGWEAPEGPLQNEVFL